MLRRASRFGAIEATLAKDLAATVDVRLPQFSFESEGAKTLSSLLAAVGTTEQLDYNRAQEPAMQSVTYAAAHFLFRYYRLHLYFAPYFAQNTVTVGFALSNSNP